MQVDLGNFYFHFDCNFCNGQIFISNNSVKMTTGRRGGEEVAWPLYASNHLVPVESESIRTQYN